jgi:hypothetical protein
MAALAAVTGVARAEDPAIIAPVTDDAMAASASPDPQRFLLFSGVDLWRASAAAYGGLHWAPGGLNEDGLIARLLLSRNIERYADTSSTISRVSALAGLRFKQGEFELKLMAGPQLESNDPASPDASLRGTRLGLQAVAESWWEPMPALMLASSWSATTLGTGYGGRLAAGLRLFDVVWCGPEVSAFTDAFTTQTRLGLHLTSLRWQDLEWSAATGYLQDSYHRNGAYGRLGVLIRR